MHVVYLQSNTILTSGDLKQNSSTSHLLTNTEGKTLLDNQHPMESNLDDMYNEEKLLIHNRTG